MTRIEEVEISGLAGRSGNFHVLLQPDLNVFWGLNGAGKTTLLRILHSALSNNARTLVRLPFDEARVRFYSEDFDILIERTVSRKSFREEIAHEADLEDDDGFRDILIKNEMQWKTTFHGKRPARISPRFQHQYLPISRLNSQPSTLRTEAGRTTRDEFAFEKAFVEAVQGLWVRLVNESYQRGSSVQQKGIADIMMLSVTGRSDHRPHPRLENLDPSEAYEIVVDFLRSQIHSPRKRLSKSAFVKEYRTPARQALVSIILNLSDDVERAAEPLQRLTSLLNTMYVGSKRIVGTPQRLEIETDGGPVELSSLSSGESQLLMILLQCMNGGTSSILIDEPELSLHLDWQRSLIGAMRTVNPDAQLLLATHSPEILASCDQRSIYEL